MPPSKAVCYRRGKIRNPLTKRCVKRCGGGYRRKKFMHKRGKHAGKRGYGCRKIRGYVPVNDVMSAGHRLAY